MIKPKAYIGNITLDFGSILNNLIDINNEIIDMETWFDGHICRAADCSECFADRCPIEEYHDEHDEKMEQRQNQENIINAILEHYNVTIGSMIDDIWVRADRFIVWIEDAYTEDDIDSEQYTKKEDIPEKLRDDYCKFITFSGNHDIVLCNYNE